MNKTDDILERLRTAQQPLIDTPDELTERIMRSLDSQNSKVISPSLTECQEVRTERSGRTGLKGRSLLIIRTVLSAAALWLVGFFIYLQMDAAPPVAEQTLPSLEEVESGASTLRDAYKGYLCQECKESISYTQLRNRLYENK